MRRAILTALFILAPVPQPRPLTADLLVGRWQFSWGQMPDGWIEFREDGHYFSRHDPGPAPVFTGRWIVRGNVLTLYEGRIPCEESGEAAVCCTPYPVELSAAKYPTLTGKHGWTDVVLKRQP